MPRRPKRAKADRAEVRVRLRIAQAYLDMAELVVDEQDRDEFLNVAAGLAVLAGIAASDALSGSRLGEIHRGDHHRDAAELLRQATPDGNKLSKTFERLIDLKDAAHYGVFTVSRRKATDAVRWSRILVERAQEEVER